MKKALALVVASLLAMMMLAACGGGTSSTSTPASQPAGGSSSAAGQEPAPTGTLKVLLSEEPSSGDAFMSTLNKWAEETGNTVEPMVIPYDDQLTKFPLMAKNKDLPDLVYTTRLASLYPDEFMDLETVLDFSVFEENAVEIISKNYINDTKTAAPIQFTITMVYYNKDAFAAADIEAPAVGEQWTMDELMENAAKLQTGGVKYGAAMDASRARYDNLMYINGGSMVQKDGDSFKVAINSPENIATLEQFVAANNSGVMPKAIWAGGSTDNPGDYFKNGDVGMYFSGTWNYNTFVNDISGFEWGVMPSPKGSAGSSSILGGSGLAIPANAANTDLAASFMKWLYENPDNFRFYLELDKGMSALKGVAYAPDDEKIAADYAVMQNEVNYVTELFVNDESSSWRNYKDNEYRDYLKQAVNGDLTAAEALNSFAKELSESSEWPMAYEA